MGFLDKIIGAVLVGVFALALLTFGYQAQIENGTNGTILDDPHFEGLNNSFSSNLNTIRGDAGDQRDNFENQDPQTGDESGFGLLTIPRNIAKFTSMMFSSVNLVSNLLEDVFGIPSVVFNILGGLLTIIMLLPGWRVIKSGVI